MRDFSSELNDHHGREAAWLLSDTSWPIAACLVRARGADKRTWRLHLDESDGIHFPASHEADDIMPDKVEADADGDGLSR